MNDQNRYRGEGWEENPNEGRGSTWSRSDESSRFSRGSSSPAGYDRDRSRFAQRGSTYGRYTEDPFAGDRPFEAQDRDYRGGSSGYGRARDYQNEWSGFGAGDDEDQNRRLDRDRERFGSYGSNRGRSDYSGSSYGSSYGAGPGLRSGPYGSSYRSGSPTTSYAGRGPKGYLRSDDRIREDVCERLSENDEVDASEIEVLVSNRKVTLTGSVQNRRMKHIAEDLAEAVSGVDDVDNRITVSKPLLKDMADRLTGNDHAQQQHYANTGTKNGPASSANGLQGANGRP